jgi:hypothetical protein
MVVVELGVPIGTHHQEALRLRWADDVAEEEQRGLGRPLEIVEHEQQGCFPGRAGEPGGNGVEEAVAFRLRVGLQRSRQVGQPLGQLGGQAHKLPAMAAEALAQPVRRRVVDEVAQSLQERLVGDAQILVAAAGQHDAALGVSHLSEFGREPGLSHSRLPGEQGHPELSGRRSLPQLLEPLQVVVASHEDPPNVGQEGRHRDGRLREWLPAHLTDGNRLGETFCCRPGYGRCLA